MKLFLILILGLLSGCATHMYENFTDQHGGKLTIGGIKFKYVAADGSVEEGMQTIADKQIFLSVDDNGTVTTEACAYNRFLKLMLIKCPTMLGGETLALKRD